MLNTSRCFLPALQGEFQQGQYSRRGSHVAVARRQCGFLSAPPNNRFKARRPRLRRGRGLNLGVRCNEN